MEPIVLRPENEQRSMWIIGWVISFILGSVICIVLLFTVGKLISALCVLGWLLLMLPILLWIPAFYKSLEYTVNTDSVKMMKGVFWRKRVTVPFTKITNIDVTQGPIQRIFNIGTIHVQTAGAGGASGTLAELQLLGIRDTDELKDTIMERVGGYTISESAVVKKVGAPENDSEIFRLILKELTAIHDVLEKRQS